MKNGNNVVAQAPVDVTVTKQHQVAILTMSGMENRVNNIFLSKWMEALDKVESWPDVQALITTGSGKFYCNGVDVAYIYSTTAKEGELFKKTLTGLRRRLLTFPMVTIAAINGHCFGVGLTIALMHDYRVMQHGRGWMCLNEVDLGIRFAPAVRAVFNAKMTPKMIREIVLFGNRYAANQALNIGLVDEISDEGKVVATSVEMAKSLTKHRTYGREILHDMKSDLYSDILAYDA